MIKFSLFILVLLCPLAVASNDLVNQELIPLETSTSIVMKTTSICLASDDRVKRLTDSERKQLSNALMFVLGGDKNKFNSELNNSERQLITHSKKHGITLKKSAIISANIFCEPLLLISTDDLSLDKEIEGNLLKLQLL